MQFIGQLVYYFFNILYTFSFEKNLNYLVYCLQETGTFSFKLISENKSYSEGFIQVPPKIFNPDDIKLITLISKFMGPFENNWEKFFKDIKSLDYNMIHFTPLQQRGISNSPYSINNQLKLSDDLFTIGRFENREDKINSLKIFFEKMEKKFGIFVMTDIVWNHTACDSDWLVDHPDAGYNLENSPHLKSAYELDENILDFSSNLKFYNINGELRNDNDLLKMMIIFKEMQLPKAKLWEFFVINLKQSENQLKEAIENGTRFEEEKYCKLSIKSLKDAETNDGKFDRFSNRMDLDKVILFYSIEINNIYNNPFQSKQLLSLLLSDYRSQLDLLNISKYQEYDEIIDTICKNIYNRALYERIAENGPKIGIVSER